ncbi:aminoacyl-tRNA hydrolase [Patescibacteria group bacterium]|nr:aminoacyl-tRNA hydrolase [Patescibacteria group bacterium]
MILFIGLGNPGRQYEHTRHNVGRETLMRWAEKNDLPDFEFNKKLKALVLKEKKFILVLPETFMNKSGNAAGIAARFFKVKPNNIIVLHDDADLELGRTKLSFNRHAAGHKGVESIKRALKTWKFWRLRIGIQKKKRMDAMKLVLQKFSPAEEATLKKTQKKIFEGLDTVIKENPDIAMNFLNQN